MRKLIAAFKISVDGKTEGPEGYADWVPAWSEDYGLTPQVDACVLGGGMYPGYEQYWTAIRNEPGKPHWIGGNVPTAGERAWAEITTRMPHYVLSITMTSAQWPNTRILRGTDDIAALKEQHGKDIYLMGGAPTVAGLLDAGLVDELRLIVYPLLAGEGAALFATAKRRQELDLRTVEQLPGGLLSLTYAVG
ncbi:dihydrofolate reductase family protein [Streptomyces sp. HPF1205]|uniref:dihydrofolate reductase family protein n=1 Tax=Streptomyces sp. HPF1205 TaxID=2873262 RepID=UPI001CEDA9E1|nr:dihydrofolate reductase family protein [Streptomyces sp. HPF1205]